MEDKDPYDLYYYLRHYPGGLNGLERAFASFKGMDLLKEAAGILRRYFATPEAPGLAAVAKAASLFIGMDADQLALDASERVLALAKIMVGPVTP